MASATAHSPPARGQRFITKEGEVWHVDDIIHSGQVPGFYILRLCHGVEAERSCLLLDRSEYRAFCCEHELKALS